MKASERIVNNSKFVNKEYVIAWTDCLLAYANDTMSEQDYDQYVEDLANDVKVMYMGHPHNKGFRDWCDQLDEARYGQLFEVVNRTIWKPDWIGGHWSPNGPIRCWEDYQELGASNQELTLSFLTPPEATP